MIALLTTLAFAGGPIGFDRIDLLAEDPGTWLAYDAGSGNTTAIGVRFITQVKPVWTTPVDGLTVGTSLSSQSLVYEHPLVGGLSLGGGVQTRLMLPAGAVASFSYWAGPVRVAGGLSVLSSASWANPSWASWHALPTVGLGVGRRR
ncbi:MAG: hypothetical protein JXX28_06935 [Deltaproteobacteria bacterium]|nr:hypothetical protein [Deltaproteobacteria bacterium]